MTAPGHQEFPAARMPVEEREGGVRVKVIAGSTRRARDRWARDRGGDGCALLRRRVAGGRDVCRGRRQDTRLFVVVHEGTVNVGGHEVPGVGLAQLGEGDAVFTVIGGPGEGAADLRAGR